MSLIVQTLEGLGRREVVSLPAATTQRVFSTLSRSAPARRQAVNLCNADASSDLYVAFAGPGDSAPALSAGDHDLILPPKTSRALQIGPNVEIWIRSNSAGPIAVTALELL